MKKHAALGGITMALELGAAIIKAEAKGGSAVIDAICRQTRGEIIGQGRVTRKAVTYTQEAFDIGTITIGNGASQVTMHVMNEYMAADDGGGKRLATYPDVITTLSPDGVPMSVGEINEGQDLLILRVVKDRIPLSSSATDPSVYPICEAALGISIADYALGPRRKKKK